MHFVDSDFKLHKNILSFVDVPPPLEYSGILKQRLRENLNLQKELVLGGTLFNVRCCAHILNFLIQDSLAEIYSIIHNVRGSVKHVNASPGKQFSISKKHLIQDVFTRWNATYAMLSNSLEFKEVFKKVEDVCSFLALFEETTKIICGSKYPTSNLFLSEMFGIKEALDAVV
uniref:hAT-like transposase RNase-H fold domain-containing protein n=1 Tax=Lactuca sativa TaxID=4236 RepID=A0A9R1W5D7_LACSA|nr:hypothetical protein LSAT_V11C200058380 [Lactuca sativa]